MEVIGIPREFVGRDWESNDLFDVTYPLVMSSSMRT